MLRCRILFFSILTACLFVFLISSSVWTDDYKMSFIKLGELAEALTAQNYILEDEDLGPLNNNFLQGFLRSDSLVSPFEAQLNSSMKATLTKIYGNALIGSSYLGTKGDFWNKNFPAKRVLLVSTNARCGSSFTGELISSFPGSFYVFEPLVALTKLLKLDKNLSSTVLSKEVLRGWLSCSFGDHSEYFSYFLKSNFHLKKSNPLKQVCTVDSVLCHNRTFIENLCSIHPVNVVKVIRTWVKDVEEYLLDESLSDLKVILLLRDPRAMLASKKTIGWCKHNSKCVEGMAETCRKLNDDIDSFQRLAARYPGRLYVIRHEDMSMNVKEEAKQLFQFLQLPLSTDTADFIVTHTTGTSGGGFSTMRNSTLVPYKWLGYLNRTDIIKLEKICRTPMEKAGYPMLGKRPRSAFRYLDLPFK